MRAHLSIVIFICTLTVFAMSSTLLCGAAGSEPNTDWPPITSECKPWTYWWWMGSAVDNVNLTQQLEMYEAAGMGGMHIVPIYGAKGYEDRYIDYLSPTWMDRLSHTVTEANRLGMGIDMTTGTGWCFGGPNVTTADAGAKVIHNVYSVSGGQTLDRTFSPQSTQALVAYEDSGAVVDLTGMIAPNGTVNWTAPSGSWDVYYVSQQSTGRMVKRSAPGGSGYMLNPFSQTAMTNYLQKFDNAFNNYTGPMPRGMYHDSYEYDTNWSPAMFNEFEQRRGYRLQTKLPALFGQGSADTIARVKSDYRRTVSEVMTEGYIGQWDAWANSKGMKTRNQAHGSPGNLLDLYAAADIPETEMFNKDRNPLVAKFASSAAHVMDKKLVSAETGTWLKEHFNTTLADMKSLADEMFISGVNHIVYHGTAYSPDDSAWPGWVFYASTEMNPRNAIWRDSPTLNSYIARSQSIMQSSRPDNNILLYWPISDMWHDSDGMAQSLTVHGDSWLTEHSIGQVADNLWNRGFAFDYVSDKQIGLASGDANGITVPGGNYDVVVVPECDLMPEDTLLKLYNLAAQGNTVIFQNKLPEDVPGYRDLAERRTQFNDIANTISPTPVPGKPVQQALLGQGRFLIGDVESALEIANVKRETLVDINGVEFVRHARDDGYDYFITNLASTPMYKWTALSTSAQSALLMDPMTGKTGAASTRQGESQQTEVLLYLEGGETMIVRTFNNEDIDSPVWNYLRPEGNPVEISGNWQVDFIDGGPVLPGSFQTTQLDSWTTLGDNEAKRFAGTARYQITFDAPPGNPDQWVLDLGKVAESARVKLNGHSLGTLITTPKQIPMEHMQATGNVLEIEVTNLSMNRIRDLDIRDVNWQNFYDINFVNIDYQHFDASQWPIKESGLLGPVLLRPMTHDSMGMRTLATNPTIMLDDFSGNLDAYSKSVVLTTSADNNTVSLTKTDYSIQNNELVFSSSVTNDKAYQTVFLRDDFSLDVGMRVQIDVTSFDSTATNVPEFGLCVAEKKDHTFGAPRENYLTIGLYASTVARSVMFNGTDYSTAQLSDVDPSLVTGFYIDRTGEDSYDVGYSTALGDVYVATRSYTGGSAAIGFYSDIRESFSPYITLDNLVIIDKNQVLYPLPGDANNDGVVNSSDATALASNWLKKGGATWAEGDFNGDGNVDDKDVTILAANWQSDANSAHVPEPSTLALILGGLLLQGVAGALGL